VTRGNAAPAAARRERRGTHLASSRDVNTAGLAAMLALSVLLGALASLATRHPPSREPTAASPYLTGLDGAVQSHARDAGPAAGGGGGRASSSDPGDGGAPRVGAHATTPAAAPTSGEASRGLVPAATGTRRVPGLATALGREVASLAGNADISVLAIGHHGGSFAYSRSDGWLRLDGNTWVVVDYSELPPDLKAAYPPEVYGGKGHGVRESSSGSTDTGQPFDPRMGRVLFEPAPKL
jgi:hypothetical protein